MSIASVWGKFLSFIKITVLWMVLYVPIKWVFKKLLEEDIKPLHETRIFIAGISIPLFLTVSSFGILCYKTGCNRNWRFDSFGFDRFFEIYRFPLWVLVGTAGLTALSVALQRSRETEKQIQLIGEKNDFDRYVKHKELVEEDIKSVLESFNKQWSENTFFSVDINVFYAYFFPDNSFKVFNEFFVPKELLAKNFEEYFNELSKDWAGEEYNTEFILKKFGMFLTYNDTRMPYTTRGFYKGSLDLLAVLYNFIDSNYSKV